MVAAAAPRRGDSRLARVAAAVWVLAILATLGVGAFGSPSLQATFLDDGPGCIFRLTTGVLCAFCGMTHATVALGAGDWAGAHGFHPLALVVVIGLAGVLGVIVAGRTELLLRGRRPIVMLGVIVALWAVRLVA